MTGRGEEQPGESPKRPSQLEILRFRNSQTL